MNAGQRVSDSEWTRILKAGDLVFGVSLWSCLVLQLDLCSFVLNFYLIIDWLIVALYIHCELLKSTYLFNINK